MLVHRERRMAIMIAAYAASSTKGANHDIIYLYVDMEQGIYNRIWKNLKIMQIMEKENEKKE